MGKLPLEIFINYWDISNNKKALEMTLRLRAEIWYIISSVPNPFDQSEHVFDSQ